jgi:uncharacterized protein
MAREANRRLCDAARLGDVTEIKRQLALGADASVLVDDWTPLHWAGTYGHLAAIAALLAAGAGVDGTNSAGYTPLMFTVDDGHAAVAAALLSAGADANHASADGYTALHRASMYGHVEAARALLEAGARTDVRRADGKRPLDVVRAITRLLA